MFRITLACLVLLVSHYNVYAASGEEAAAGHAGGGATAVGVVEITDNKGLSSAEARALRSGYYRADAVEGGEIFEIDDLTPSDLFYTTVQVFERKGNEKLHEAGSLGTSFIVADSREESLVGHRKYLPFNYDYNPALGEKSPKLYLVSNMHVFRDKPYTIMNKEEKDEADHLERQIGINSADADDRADAQADYDEFIAKHEVTSYILAFHYARSTPGAVELSSDFRAVRVHVPIAALGIVNHPDVEGHQLDLACIPLNRIFDALDTLEALAGYKPVFAAFDTNHHFAPRSISGISGSAIAMHGFPAGHADAAKRMPLITKGTCSTAPKELQCDTFVWSLAPEGSIIDFKMDLTDLGGSSGSPITFVPRHLRSNLLLGINWGAHASDLIGFGIHSERLKEFIEADEMPAPPTASLILVVSPKIELAPAAAGAGGSGGGHAAAGAGASGGGYGAAADRDASAEGRNAVKPKVIKASFTYEGVMDHKMKPAEMDDIIARLGVGPSVLNFSSNNLRDDNIRDLLGKIKERGLLGNIVVLNLYMNNLMDFDIIKDVLREPTLRFLDITGNRGYDPTDAHKKAVAMGCGEKLISAPKSFDFAALKKMGVPLSVDAHKRYHKEFK